MKSTRLCITTDWISAARSTHSCLFSLSFDCVMTPALHSLHFCPEDTRRRDPELPRPLTPLILSQTDGDDQTLKHNLVTTFSPASLRVPAVTVSWALLLTEPCGLEAVQQNRPPSSGKASAITKVHISSRKNNHSHTFNDPTNAILDV